MAKTINDGYHTITNLTQPNTEHILYSVQSAQSNSVRHCSEEVCHGHV